MDSNSLEDYSSGCESGWTDYFERSRGSVDDQEYCVNRSKDWDEEEEDLSMVSDASSGPAQVSQDNHYNCYMTGGMTVYSFSTDEDGALVRNKQQKRRSKKARPGEKQVDSSTQDHMLDDTASSRPDFSYSTTNNNDDHQLAALTMQKMMDFSQDHFSTSYFQASASTSALHGHHYDQVHFHQEYNW